MVYQGKITSTQPNYNDKVYFGVAEKSLKDYTKSYTHENNIELSKEYWEIKRSNFIPRVTRSIV